MTEERKELLKNTFEDYKLLAEEIELIKGNQYDTQNFRGKKLELIKILIDLDNKLVENKQIVEEEKEEKPTTKKK